MSSVISVENLSKKYIIGHQEQERYTALRDVLTEGAKRFTHKLTHPFTKPKNDPTHEEFWALKDISFDIKQGDRVRIIGRNGAGKSTLFKILSRITDPTTGQIKIKGRVASLLEVGTGTDLTIRELAEAVARVLSHSGKFVQDTSKPDGTMRKVMDVSKTKSLGWKVKRNLQDGITLTYNLFKEVQK
jgi:ABC-type polysaccharide/polyol phosphate transport system ATPase subunit